ncbi:MAG: GntR family transcriptional regulator [Mangrovicoccus sp.]|nr:GntR family transcriptional regulator [Mangrovicoccus sp.]
MSALDQTPVKSLHSKMILDALEAEIVSGHLPPGARLGEASLAQRFGVSRTPVREALQNIVSRSLAERVPFKGVVVSDFNQDRLRSLFDAMAEMEALCGGFAALHMDGAALDALEAVHLRMSELASSGSSRPYEEANTDFHSMIYRGSGNEHLAQLAFDLRLKLAPFRKSQLYQPVRMHASNQEHDLIVQLLRRRNKPGVEQALRDHLQGAHQAVISARQDRDET